MSRQRADVDHVVDLVWAHALEQILKGGGASPLRPALGDDIDLAVPQVHNAALLVRTSAFARMLYNSGYEAAKRNAYLVLRRVGMPTDFFWKFDYWDTDRAFQTMEKIMGRVFAALLTKQKAGALKLVSVDMDRGSFEVEFTACAECAGLSAQRPLCLYHAGAFAGVVSAMLDRELDAYEVACTANGAPACRFLVAKRDDRRVMVPLDDWLSGSAAGVDLAARMEASLSDHAVRAMGNLVDMGYYQAVLASSCLRHLDVLEQACVAAGEELGKAMLPVIRRRFPVGPAQAVAAYYRHLRYADVVVVQRDAGFEVLLSEAPEAMGPLANAAVVPFVVGELQALLTGLLGQRLRHASVRSTGGTLVLAFVPEAG